MCQHASCGLPHRLPGDLGTVYMIPLGLDGMRSGMILMY